MSIRKKHLHELTTSLRMYNREHEPHSYPTHSGRPDTYGLAYLTPAKVRSPTGRDSRSFTIRYPTRDTLRPYLLPRAGANWELMAADLPGHPRRFQAAKSGRVSPSFVGVGQASADSMKRKQPEGGSLTPSHFMGLIWFRLLGRPFTGPQ